MTENEVAREVVDAAYKIHTTFGPGLLESVYETIMAYELQKRHLRVRRQKPIPVYYEDVKMNVGFRADLVIDENVLVEVKSVEAINPVHKKQLLTYLKVADKKLGLLINFNIELIKHGITRVVNQLQFSRRDAKARRRKEWRSAILFVLRVLPPAAFPVSVPGLSA